MPQHKDLIAAELAEEWRALLAFHRKASGLSNYALADEAGIDKGLCWRVENEGRLPSVRTQQALAEALGLPVAALFPRDSDEFKVAVREQRKVYAA